MKMKKIVALICMVCMLSTMCFQGISVSAEDTGNAGSTGETTELKELDNLTLLDVGMSDGANQTISKTMSVDSLDNKIFSVWLTFNKSSRFHYAVDNTTHGYGGIGFRLNESDTSKLIVGNELTGTKYNTDAYPGVLNQMPLEWVTLDAQTAGVGDEANGYSFEGNKFLLQISTEFFEGNDDGEENDIRFGIYINGKLYGNEYHTLLNSVGKLGKDFNFNNANMAFFGSYIPDVELTEWSIHKAGLHDGTYSADYSGTSTTETLANTSFSTMVSFPTNGTANLWIGEVNNGFVFQGQEGNRVYFAHMRGSGTPVYGTTLIMDGVQLTGNRDLKLTFTVEDYKSIGMKIGIYFNGVLYNDNYVYLPYSAESLPRTLSFACWSGGTIWLGDAVTTQYDVFLDESSNVMVSCDRAVEFAVGDKYYMTYTVEALARSQTTTEKLNNGIVTTASCREDAAPYKGTKGQFAYATQVSDLTQTNDGSIIGVGNTYMICVEVTDTGRTYSVIKNGGTPTTLPVSLSHTGTTGTTHFGLWISPYVTGKLTNVKCYDSKGNDLGVWGNSTYNVSVYEKESENLYCDLGVNSNGYKVPYSGTLTSGSETVADGVATLPGTYQFAYTLNTNNYSGDVWVYLTGDVNTDGSLDVRDLVRMEKGLSSEDKVAQRSADVSKDGIIDTDEYALLDYFVTVLD